MSLENKESYKNKLCVALHYYIGRCSDELTITVGDKIRIMEEAEPGWLRGIRLSDNAIGMFPITFVRVFKESSSTAKKRSFPFDDQHE